MFKAIAITNNQFKFHNSTLNRQIISQFKNQVYFSPQTSPIKCQKESKFLGIQKKQNQINHLNRTNDLLKISQVKAEFKLFHVYYLQKNQQSMQQSLIEKKRQQATILAHLKTNIIGIFNVSQESKKKILQKLLDLHSEIQYIDILNSSQILQRKQSQISKNQHLTISNMIIYFKNTLISQEIYNQLYKDYHLLPIYLKEVLIIKRNYFQELTYEEILNFFKYTKFQNQKQINLKKQIQIYEKRWIQLPKCPKCLLKLQFQVSGIQDKILFLVSQNQSNKILTCQTCEIIQHHQKFTEGNRKVSYQQGYNYNDYKSQKHTHCVDCKQKSDIWICMICSKVGCGRYKNADAYKHFVKSGHVITIDLETQRVWNYLSDCFSHKLLKTINETGNIKFPQLKNQEGQNYQQSTLQQAFWQYCSIFSQQMQRQRLFYENIKNSQKDKFQKENEYLDKIINQLQKQKQQKQNLLKKSIKQKNKIIKKQKQINQKVENQREMLKQYQNCIKNKNQKLNFQNDEDIIHKKKILQELQIQMNQLLIKLSNDG